MIKEPPSYNQSMSSGGPPFPAGFTFPPSAPQHQQQFQGHPPYPPQPGNYHPIIVQPTPQVPSVTVDSGGQEKGSCPECHNGHFIISYKFCGWSCAVFCGIILILVLVFCIA